MPLQKSYRDGLKAHIADMKNTGGRFGGAITAALLLQEFIGDNVDAEGLNIEDTYKLVEDYIDGVDTDLEKDRIKVSMRELMAEAQALEIA